MAAVLFRFVSLLSVQCLRLSCSTDGAEQKESASVCKYLPQFQDRLVADLEFWSLYILYVCIHTHTSGSVCTLKCFISKERTGGDHTHSTFTLRTLQFFTFVKAQVLIKYLN